MKQLLVIVIFIMIMALTVNAQTLVRLDDPWPPFIMDNPSGPEGFTVDLLKAMVQKVPNVEIQYKFYPWKRVLANIANQPKSFTFLERTKKREQAFKWVGPVLRMNMSIFKLSSRKDLRIMDLTDQRSHQIGIVAGYATEKYLLDIGIRKEQIEEVNRGELNIRKLFIGRVDFVFENSIVMAHYVKKEGHQFHEVELVQANAQGANYFAFNLGTDDRIIQQLQHALDRLKQSGEYDSILKKYTQ